MPLEDVSAFVLAGGKSSRMGSDKAFLTLGGETLLARAVRTASLTASRVYIAGSATKFAPFGEVLDDVFPERGPLGGIHAALTRSPTEWNVMLAVDLPWVSPNLLAYLMTLARSSSAIVTVPFIEGRYQPLCAVYRKQFWRIATIALVKGQNKIDALFPEIELQVVQEAELASQGFPAETFDNVNRPEEWEAAKAQLETRERRMIVNKDGGQ